MSNEAMNICLIIPAYNEAESLPAVLARIPACISSIVVVDNGSTDGTGELAEQLGARVVSEPQRGYGQACLAGIAALQSNPPDLVAFADADGSDNHPELEKLITTLQHNTLDLVLAQRIPKTRRALSIQQRFGNRLATSLVSLIWRTNFRDLGPMRVIRWQALLDLNMADQNFGWTIEMQVKAAQQRLRWQEIPITYLPRFAGQSKISRTISGVIQAGTKILWIVARETWRDRRNVVSLRTQHRCFLRYKKAAAVNNRANTGANQM
ncbi:MAG: glycosyl transferase family 2 [Desulfobacteraceae bacterium 4572_35.2]|nr:MAG: glycosyl transferase family 2 [Desulfobacteraceae bacterium 4572_35.2]